MQFGVKTAIGVVVVMAVAFGGVLLGYRLLFGRSGAAAAGGPATEVTVTEIRPERLELTTELPGRTVPYLVAEIRPQVSGLIQKRVFTEGAVVKEGDVLYQIDSAPYKAALDNAQANLEMARKAADRARATLGVSQAGVNRQKATLALAKINRDRALKLFQEAIIPASQRDAAVTEADVAAATLASQEAQVESDAQGVASAEAAIKQSQAALETARINLGYTTITAPISGRIGISAVTIGAMVTGYQAQALATIQQLDPVYVDVPQSTNALLQLRKRLQDRQSGNPGEQRVRLILEDGGAYAHEGVLRFQDVTVDTSTGTVTLRAVFPNPSGLLLGGVFVRAVISEGVEENALLVPQQAVMRDVKGQPYVMVAGKDDLAERRMLTLGQAAGGRWQVLSGLSAGARVIVDGLQKIRPGGAVKPLPAGAQAAADAPAPAGKPAK